MMLNIIRKRFGFASPQSSYNLGAWFAHSHITNLTSACLALAGVLLISPSALSQGVERSMPEVEQHSTCVTDPQGLMCHASSGEIGSKPSLLPQAGATPTAALQPLTNAQMEQLSDMLLGFLYFVLPIGCGLGLFLYDRHQANRAALLDAQIKLLEKLWEQSPQA